MIDILENVVAIISTTAPIFAMLAGWMIGQVKNSNKEDRAIKDGVKMLLRVKIIDKCLSHLEDNHITPYELDIVKELYASYVALGNGDKSIGDLIERTKKLPMLTHTM